MRANSVFLSPVVLAGASLVASCVANTSSTGTSQSALGCPEFDATSGLNASVKVDARVRTCVQSAVDLGGVASSLKTSVKTACAGIATDLGANDTWTSIGDTDDAISNGNKTGACDAARSSIVAVMSAHPEANFALVLSRGECHTNFDEEVKCEAGCNSQQTCTPGTVDTRCDPAQLSVVCSGNCAAQATCEGHVDAQANCDGQCEAECTGHCSGRCDHDDGTQTNDDPNCHGKCNAQCTGTCDGRCKVQAAAGVQCGANVWCKGGCTSQFTQPQCETECTPPSCTLDQSCFESCRASAAANAICTPPTVKLLAAAGTSSDVAKIVATIDKNLPPLLQSAEAQGQIFVDAVQNLSTSGKALLQASGSLDLKSVSCATAAGESLAGAGATLQVSTQAGAGVLSDCSSHAD